MIATLFTSKIISYIGNVKLCYWPFIYITANLEIVFWNSDISTNQIIINSYIEEFLLALLCCFSKYYIYYLT